MVNDATPYVVGTLTSYQDPHRDDPSLASLGRLLTGLLLHSSLALWR